MPVRLKKKHSLKERVLTLKKVLLTKWRRRKSYKIDGQELTDDIETTPSWTRFTALSFGFGSFFLLNYLLQGIVLILQFVAKRDYSAGTWENLKPFDWSRLFQFRLPLLVYLILALFCASVATVMYQKLSFKFRTLSRGQKGDNRLTRLDELKDQYKKIPERRLPFKGIGGTIISHYKQNYLIDTDKVNTGYIGNTRSGKDEIYVVPKIDNLSRAEIKTAMVINDVKGETLAAMKEPLEQRGYEVLALNLIDPMRSLSFQMLQLVIDYWKEKNYDTVQLLVNSLTFSLYYDPQASGNSVHFNETAQGVVSAVILALLEECDKLNELHKVTMYNVCQFLIEMGLWKDVDVETGQEVMALDEYFKKLPAGSMAKAQYASANFAGDREKGSILSTAVRKLRIFMIDAIAKMTSANSFDLKRVGFPNDIQFEFDTSMKNQRIRVTFYREKECIGKEVIMPSRNGTAVLNFPYSLKTGDRVVLRYASPLKEIQTATYTVTFPKDENETHIELVEDSSNFETLRSITMTCQRKPLAIFLLVPDSDKALHPISSIFIGQLYQALLRNCAITRGGECHVRVNIICNEFGNMPPISNLDSAVTACLGRNILFDFFVQSLEQFYDLYGDKKGKTIIENCQNLIYIMSKNPDTIKRIHEMVGHRTVDKQSTSDRALSLDNSATTSADGEDLITKERLGTLIMGETVVLRTMHRQDNKGNKIRPYPIFNTKETTLPYRYEFLAEDFDPKRDLASFDFPSLHEDLELDSQRIDVTRFFSWGGFSITSDPAVEDVEPTTPAIPQTAIRLEEIPIEIQQLLSQTIDDTEEVAVLVEEILHTTAPVHYLLSESGANAQDLNKITQLITEYNELLEE